MEQQDIVKAVKQAKKGNKKAMALLYEQSHNSIYFLILRMTGGNEQDALDVVQDSFIKAFASLGALKDDGKFIPWLNKIAINEAKQYVKKQSGRGILFMGMDAVEEPEEVAEDFIPQEYLESSITRQLVMEIIDGLNINQKMCVMMFYYHNMTISEIAVEMDCTESTVKSRLNYAKTRIKKRWRLWKKVELSCTARRDCLY